MNESLAPRYSLGLRVLKLPKVKEGAVNNALGAAILPFGTQDAEEFTASRNGQEAGMYLLARHDQFVGDRARIRSTERFDFFPPGFIPALLQ